MDNTVFLTVISGVLIFVIKELIQNFILYPIKEYKETIGKIDNKIKYYTNIITNSGFQDDVIRETSLAIRELSCDLEANYKQVPFKNVFSLIKLVPNQKIISESAKSLIRLSNTGGQSGREGMNVDEIAKLRKGLDIVEI